jgi:hypothetical protein
MSGARWIAGAAAAFALVAVGRLTAPAGAPTVIATTTATTPAVAQPRIVYAPTTARLDDRDLDRLREALRPPAADPASAPAIAPVAEPAAPERAQLDAAAAARIDAVVARGRWTAADHDALLADMIGMSQDGRAHVLSALVVAINAGQVRLDPGVAVF